jgi:opacity protein-like surface antigen
MDTAMAETSSYRNYGAVRFGLNEFNGDLEADGYDTGGDVSVAYGRHLTPYLVLETAVNAFGTEKEMHGSTGIAGNYKREDTIAVVALLATIRGELPTGPLTLFAGGGVGGYLLVMHSEISTAYFDDIDENSDDSVLGVHTVAGVKVDITQRLFAELQGLYRWTDDIDINESTGSVPVRLGGNLNGYAVTLSAGFRF